MQAALAYVEGRTADHDAAVAAALKINPTYGEIHRVVGSITAHYYRFDEAVEHVRKGIALDPRQRPSRYADLGAHLMRTGDERNARRALETAFKVDPWNVRHLQPAGPARSRSSRSTPSAKATWSFGCIRTSRP